MLLIKNERRGDEMRKKILWLGLSFLLVAALVLASCAPAVGEQEEEEEEEEEPAVGEPQRGGTLTMIHYRTGVGVENWDILAGYWSTPAWVSPFLENLGVGDVEKYGPRGTNEYSFTNVKFVPDEFTSGELAESWELTTDPLGVIYHIRPGVYWTGNEHIDMEPREFTAYDAAFVLNRYHDSPAGYRTLFMGDIYAADKYTFVVEFDYPIAEWLVETGSGALSGNYPQEAVEAGISDWKNQVSTGPFILTDFVDGSQATYERNPDYWGKTTINGQEYQLPFIDKLVFPIIPDESTQLAALRTGQADLHIEVPLIYEDSLAQTNPELIKYKYLRSDVRAVAFHFRNSKYFGDRNIRRAMMIGTDLQFIRDALYMEGEIHGYPFNSNTPFYTPIEEMPASTRMLFEYNPELARQMIADVYPDGISIELVILPSAEHQDIASMLESMWGEIGVDTKLITLEYGPHTNLRYSHDYKDAYLFPTGTTIPSYLSTGYYAEGTRPYNFSTWYDPYFDEQYAIIEGEMDSDKMVAMSKELSVYLLDAAAYLPLPLSFANCYTWPWVKNYYGELETGYQMFGPIASRIWIDQVLKTDMGY